MENNDFELTVYKNPVYEILNNSNKTAIMEIAKKCKEADECVLIDVMSINEGSKYFSELKSIAKLIEEKRIETVSPFNEKVKMINLFYKSILSIVDSSADRISKELVRIKKEETEKERIKAEEEQNKIKQQIEQEKKQDNNDIDSNDTIMVMPTVMPKQVKLSTMNDYGIKTVEVPKWELVDINLVPKEYLTLDEKKVQKFRRECGTDPDKYLQYQIPGIRFYNETQARK